MRCVGDIAFHSAKLLLVTEGKKNEQNTRITMRYYSMDRGVNIYALLWDQQEKPCN